MHCRVLPDGRFWGSLAVRAFTSADADTMFDANAKAFYVGKDGLAWFKESTDGGKASYFWDQSRTCPSESSVDRIS